MTAYRFVTLTCDGCGEVFDNGQSLTVASARRAAKAEAWTNPSRGRDHCPLCSGTRIRIGGVMAFIPKNRA
ncbi:MAG TPA: hypothetical protein VL043_11765 [Protaetiibacter sp.]|nr:hypothetical protein [Protaetiibacter sp.]